MHEAANLFILQNAPNCNLQQKIGERKFPGNLALVEALLDMVKKSMASMQTTQRILLIAASLLVSTSWTAKTNMEMVGMVDLLRSEEQSIARILQQDTAKNNRFPTQV